MRQPYLRTGGRIEQGAGGNPGPLCLCPITRRNLAYSTEQSKSLRQPAVRRAVSVPPAWFHSMRPHLPGRGAPSVSR